MVLEKFLLQNERSILKRWLDLILETYPADTVTLMRKDKDRFTNPVGSALSRDTEILFRKVCEGVLDEECQASLNSILKIRSVQDFSPPQAVEFVFLLRKAIWEILKSETDKASLLKEWLEFQSRIDDLALQAFDIYMGCREKICEIRIDQARSEKEMAFKMMERMTYSKTKQ